MDVAFYQTNETYYYYYVSVFEVGITGFYLYIYWSDISGDVQGIYFMYIL